MTEPKPRSIARRASSGSSAWSRCTATRADDASATASVARAIGSSPPWYRTQFSESWRMTGRPASSAAPARASAVSRCTTLKAPMPRPAARASSRSVRVGVSVIGVPRRSSSGRPRRRARAWSGESSPASGMSTALADQAVARRARSERARSAASVADARSSPAARADRDRGDRRVARARGVAVQHARAGGRATGAPPRPTTTSPSAPSETTHEAGAEVEQRSGALERVGEAGRIGELLAIGLQGVRRRPVPPRGCRARSCRRRRERRPRRGARRARRAPPGRTRAAGSR